MKRCVKCGVTQDASRFNRSPKNRDGLHSYCRECQKQHYRDNYARHLANVRRTSEARTRHLRGIVWEAMKDGCVDCGNRDARLLEFDHVRGKKLATIGELVRRGAGEQRLRREMAKCQVRCRNCHAIATIARRGGSWHDWLT